MKGKKPDEEPYTENDADTAFMKIKQDIAKKRRQTFIQREDLVVKANANLEAIMRYTKKNNDDNDSDSEILQLNKKRKNSVRSIKNQVKLILIMSITVTRTLINIILTIFILNRILL